MARSAIAGQRSNASNRAEPAALARVFYRLKVAEWHLRAVSEIYGARSEAVTH
jgi:hypothetical protein